MDRPARNAILGAILDFGLAAVSPPRGHPEIAALELHSVLGTTYRVWRHAVAVLCSQRDRHPPSLHALLSHVLDLLPQRSSDPFSIDTSSTLTAFLISQSSLDRLQDTSGHPDTSPFTQRSPGIPYNASALHCAAPHNYKTRLHFMSR